MNYSKMVRYCFLAPNCCRNLFCTLVLAAAFCSPIFAQAQDSGSRPPDKKALSFTEALKKGKLAVNLRYRFEYVTDDTTVVTDKDARASTLRTALSYQSQPFHGFAGLVEFENVSVLGENLFNNRGAGRLFNGVTDRPAVADPKLTEVNQVYVELTAIPNTVIHAGREEILLDNMRFVGNVGWRQNHQSFDSVSVINKSISKTTVTYSHLFTARRVFGDSKPMNSNLFNVSVQPVKSVKLTAYAYLLDYDHPSDFGLTSNTFGFRFSGSRSLAKGWNALYDFEYAKQLDGGNTPHTIDEDYYRLEGGAEKEGCFTFKAGREVLGGSPATGQFSTPLATLHTWNGWADKFLSTPVNGLKDTYVSLGSNPKKFGLNGIFHWFRSQTGSMDYGKEVNLLITYTSPWKQVFAFKTALYRADGFSADTDKVMIYSTYSF